MNLLSNIDKGKIIEDYAADFIKKQGLVIIKRNFTTKIGEIDIIATEKNLSLVFIEVRYRKNLSFGGPLASINYTKQQKISKTASIFLTTYKWNEQIYCRFDVIAVTGNMQNLKLQWIKNAFTA